MLVAHDDKGHRKVASKELKGGYFTCPDCKEEVAIRLGDKRVAHFAHKIGQQCRMQEKKNRARQRALRKINAQLEKKASQGQGLLFGLDNQLSDAESP